MKRRNIWTDVPPPLGVYKDNRGEIADILVNDPIDSMVYIKTKTGEIRGNSYHKHIQHQVLIVCGWMEIWCKPFDAECEPEFIHAGPGDLVTIEPGEIHALRSISETEIIETKKFLTASRDYEADTYRVKILS